VQLPVASPAAHLARKNPGGSAAALGLTDRQHARHGPVREPGHHAERQMWSGWRYGGASEVDGAELGPSSANLIGIPAMTGNQRSRCQDFPLSLQTNPAHISATHTHGPVRAAQLLPNPSRSLSSYLVFSFSTPTLRDVRYSAGASCEFSGWVAHVGPRRLDAHNTCGPVACVSSRAGCSACLPPQGRRRRGDVHRNVPSLSASLPDRRQPVQGSRCAASPRARWPCLQTG
jgi:hypothetical protein